MYREREKCERERAKERERARGRGGGGDSSTDAAHAPSEFPSQHRQVSPSSPRRAFQGWFHLIMRTYQINYGITFSSLPC